MLSLGSCIADKDLLVVDKTNSNLHCGSSPVLIATVPLTGQPILEASQAPPTADSKFEDTNLNYLKNRLEPKMQVT